MFSIFNKNKFKSTHVNDVEQIGGNINLIDIREPYEYDSGHLPKAKNVPMNLILTDTEKYLDKSKEYHIICQSGGRSSKACNELVSKGYKVVNVSGGTGSHIRPLER